LLQFPPEVTRNKEDSVRNFLLGFVVGAASLYGSMCFHIVRAEDGHHFVPKTGLSFRDTYVDIRKFGLSEWRGHVGLAEAILKADKSKLMGGSAENTFRDVFDGFLTQRPQ
jgi:hypothetical protein